MLLLTLLLACATEPTPATPAVEPLDLDVTGKQADLPWLQAPGPVAGNTRAEADQAFNTAMMAYESGDQAAAAAAIPRAMEAYQALPVLDADGRFHLAVLMLAAQDPAAARSQAERMLQDHPTHLLALGAALRASTALRDGPAARAYAERYVAAWPTEQGAMPEYGHHGGILPRYLAEAEALLAQ